MSKSRFRAAILAMSLLAGAGWQTIKASDLVDNLDNGKQQTVVTYGTSLTAGGAWVKQLQDALNARYPGKAKVVNSGKGSMWSTWGVENLDTRVIDKKPDTILIEFAINDAYLPYKTSVEQAQDNLENMIERIQKDNPKCEIILMVMNPPIGAHLERRPKIEEYYEMYRNVANDRKLLLIDHYPNWQKILKTDADLFKKYVPDGIHPGPEGCKVVITPEIIKSLGIEAEQPDGAVTQDFKIKTKRSFDSAARNGLRFIRTTRRSSLQRPFTTNRRDDLRVVRKRTQGFRKSPAEVKGQRTIIQIWYYSSATSKLAPYGVLFPPAL